MTQVELKRGSKLYTQLIKCHLETLTKQTVQALKALYNVRNLRE